MLVGAFLNAKATAQKTVEISNENIGVSFVLSGEKNRFSLEDFVCAGAIADCFPENKINLCDKARAALLAFREAKNNLLETIEKSEHAKILIERGFKSDIEFSCRINTYGITPFYQDRKILILT